MAWRSLLRLPDGTEVLSLLYPSERESAETQAGLYRYQVRCPDGTQRMFEKLSEIAAFLAAPSAESARGRFGGDGIR